MQITISFILISLLALIHILASRWTFITTIPRSIWLSLSGGISISYVFLRILPELHEGQEKIEDKNWLNMESNHIYLITLIGLVIFYGLERLARNSVKIQGNQTKLKKTNSVFWVHIFSFSIYNLLLGYLFFYWQQQELLRHIVFFSAMAAHFLVNDFGLQQTYEKLYVSKGRWILASSIILGWCGGLLFKLEEAILFVLLALMSGGIILNVFKEELPSERESKFWAFLIGVSGYSFLLLMI